MRFPFPFIFFCSSLLVFSSARMIPVTSDSAGLVLASNNGMYSAMEPSDAGADLVEKDPTGRYVRVFNSFLQFNFMFVLAFSFSSCCLQVLYEMIWFNLRQFKVIFWFFIVHVFFYYEKALFSICDH